MKRVDRCWIQHKNKFVFSLHWIISPVRENQPCFPFRGRFFRLKLFGWSFRCFRSQNNTSLLPPWNKNTPAKRPFFQKERKPDRKFQASIFRWLWRFREGRIEPSDPLAIGVPPLYRPMETCDMRLFWFLRRLFKCFSKIKYKFETQTTIKYPAVTFSYLHFRVGISWRESSHPNIFSISTCQDHSGMGLLRKSLPVSSVAVGLVMGPKVPAMLRNPLASICLQINHTTWTLKVTCRLYLCCTKATLFYNIFKFYFQYLPTAHYIRSRFHHSIPYHGFESTKTKGSSSDKTVAGSKIASVGFCVKSLKL